MLTLRPATEKDAPAMHSIYQPYIETTSFTFETEVPSVADFGVRITNCLQKYPWLVIEMDGAIAGYAYATSHRERSAYQWTCESSIYMAKQFQGKGLAPHLYRSLFSILKIQGFRTVYAGITQPNEPSVRLHQKMGFEPFAVYENVGYKLGIWHKVGWWRLVLNEFNFNPAPPILFSALKPLVYEEVLAHAVAAIEKQLSCSN